jgi:hypothetical protein
VTEGNATFGRERRGLPGDRTEDFTPGAGFERTVKPLRPRKRVPRKCEAV